MRRISLFFILAAMLLIGCGTNIITKPAVSGADSSDADTLADPQSGTPAGSDESIEFNGITKMKSELSEDTLKWLEWYHTLSEDYRNALSFVPSEFTHPGTVHTLETEDETPPAYTAALTEAELLETQELAHYYFTEARLQAIPSVLSVLPADPNPIAGKSLTPAFSTAASIVIPASGIPHRSQ